MKIKHTEIEIDPQSPFANCKLGRAKYANILTNIVGNYKDGFVLAINNEWGAGKTTFIKMWQKQLEQNEYKTLYFNSWENDFDANPLVALMAELNTLTKKETSKTFKSLVSKGAVLTKNILPQLLKAVAKRYVDTDTLVNLVEDTAKGATEILSDEINEYTEKKKGLKEFKVSLEKFIAESTNGKPLIFIIDELDRCRPNYAVEVLEQIKHLFSVPGIVFVLSIDKIQLGHAIRGVYGNDNINSEEYLRRFIDVEYSIPSPNTTSFCNYLYDYFQFDDFFYSDNRKKYTAFSTDKSALIKMAATFFEKSKLTLRQQEKLFAHARLGLAFFQENQYVFPELYLFLIFAKTHKPNFYNKLQLRVFTTTELIEEYALLIPSGIDKTNLRSFIYMEALLAHMYNNASPSHNSSLIGKDEKTGEDIVYVQSKIDTINNGAIFNHFLIDLIRHRDVDRVDIAFLMNKIDLTHDITS